MTEAARPALSTMWAVQPRFEGNLEAFLECALALGFEGIEVNHSMDASMVAVLLESAPRLGLQVTSIHAPAPLARDAEGRENRTLNLAALDEAERRAAVECHMRSIELAASANVRAVVVHLGGIGVLDAVLDGERRLRDAYLRDGVAEPDRGNPLERDTSQWEARLEAARAERALVAAPWLDAARRSLAGLASRAGELGVTLGLECRLRYHEFPLPEECAALLRDYPAAVAGYWHDVGHAEVLARLGLVPLEAWWEQTGGRLVGTHLHDVRGLTDHRAPGAGDVDFRALASRLPPEALRTFEVDQGQSEEALASGLALARAAGVIE